VLIDKSLDRIQRLYEAKQYSRIAEIAIELAKERGLGKINSIADVDFFFVKKEEETQNIIVTLFKGCFAIEVAISSKVEVKINVYK